NRFFRLTEQTGIGHTIASPKVTVTSGEQGRIQIGSDIPIQVRDFAGNTITQFVSTGIIINVTPTVIKSPVADTLGAPLLEFIHLDIRVERSTGRPFQGSVAIERAGADTQVLLLDGEMTVIGGLYGTDEIINRSGIPILKDLPWWVFGFRYIFGKELITESNNELLIVIKANLRDPLPFRAERPFPSGIRNAERKSVLDLLRRFDLRATEESWPDMLWPDGEKKGNQNNQGSEE
ncbi:MAG: type II and III secretion system protein, partial [Rhodothermia bacterium]